MSNDEYEFYNEIKNWDFSDINYTKENLSNYIFNSTTIAN